MLEPGDILLVRGQGIVSGLIELFSSSKYSHAALYCGEMYGEPLICEAEAQGVWINTLRAHKPEWDRIDVFRVKAPESYRHKTPLAAFEYVSKPYSFLELPGFLIAYATGLRSNPFANAEQFICSELIDTAYLQLFSQEYGTKSLIRPGDIARSQHVENLGVLPNLPP